MVDRLANRGLRDLDGVFAVPAKNRYADFPAERGELIGCSGTIHVARRQQRALSLLLKQVRQLNGGRGLAGTLKAHEHDDVGDAVGEHEFGFGGAQKLGQLIKDDLDDVLRGRERFHDLGGQAALLGLGDELLDDLEVDVRLEQRHADVAHRRIDVGFG